MGAFLDPRLNVITLACHNVARSRKFYERLGWKPGQHDKEVTFFQLNGCVLALFQRKAFAKDAKLPLRKVKSGGICLAQNQRTKAKVDAVMAQAKKAGAKITKVAGATFWGGYSGHFQDPDGHPWEIAWNPHWKLDNKGNLIMN
jgi:predicted lactoylglutathione lyase